MKKTMLILAVLSLAVVSCRDKTPKTTGDAPLATAVDTTGKEMWNGYMKIAPTDIEGNIVQRIGDEWMLITAGTPDSYNTMTAGWGGMGIIWSTPVSFIAVRNTRHTYGFLQKNDLYTLTFFGGGEKEAMTYLGTHSGRDGDKVAQTNLTPMETPLGSMSFAQATMILECRKLYEDKLDPKSMFDDEIAKDYLKNDERHVLFLGEIVNVWVKVATDAPAER